MADAEAEPEAPGGPSSFFLDVRQRGNKFDVGFLTAPTDLRGEQEGGGDGQRPATSCYRVHYSKNKKLVFSECSRCVDEGGTRTIRVTEYRNLNYGCGQEKSASEGAVWKLSRDGPDWAGYSMDAMTFPHGILIGRTTSNAGEEAKEADEAEPEVEAGDWDYSDLLYVFSDDNSVGIRGKFADLAEEVSAETGGDGASGGALRLETGRYVALLVTAPLIDVLPAKFVQGLVERAFAVGDGTDETKTLDSMEAYFDSWIAAWRTAAVQRSWTDIFHSFRDVETDDQIDGSTDKASSSPPAKKRKCDAKAANSGEEEKTSTRITPSELDKVADSSPSRTFPEDVSAFGSKNEICASRRLALLRDAYETRSVYVAAAGYSCSVSASVPQTATGAVPVAERAGSSGSGGEQVTSAKNGLLDHREGLFAKRAFNKGELISFYNGVRMTQEVCDARDWKENGNCVTLWKDGPGTVIDVPFPQSSMQNYCATVGHKANHSRTHVNARYGPYEGHPRFGDVVCIRAIRRIARGEEIFCDYGYGLLGASAGAEERGEADGDDGVPDWFTPEL